MLAPDAVSVPVPPPRMCVNPTKPLKSVIWDGSLILARGTAGLSGLWCTKIAKGARGAPPPGIGLGRPSSSSSAWADVGYRRVPPATVPALATRPRNARRDARGRLIPALFILPPYPNLSEQTIPQELPNFNRKLPHWKLPRDLFRCCLCVCAWQTDASSGRETGENVMGPTFEPFTVAHPYSTSHSQVRWLYWTSSNRSSR
jgi:hypothetical protein